SRHRNVTTGPAGAIVPPASPRAGTMTSLHLTLLGSFGARLGDGRVIPVRRRKARALLAYLALKPGAQQSREKLIALLWGDAEPGQSRHSLRQTLTVLRRDLAPWREPGLVLDGDTVRVEPGLVSVDAVTFQRLSAGGRRGGPGGGGGRCC